VPRAKRIDLLFDLLFGPLQQVQQAWRRRRKAYAVNEDSSERDRATQV